MADRSPTIFTRATYPEYRRILAILRTETVGGALLLIATVIALLWANSPAADAYFALRDFTIGYERSAWSSASDIGRPMACWPFSSSSPALNSKGNSWLESCVLPPKQLFPSPQPLAGRSYRH